MIAEFFQMLPTWLAPPTAMLQPAPVGLYFSHKIDEEQPSPRRAARRPQVVGVVMVMPEAPPPPPEEPTPREPLLDARDSSTWDEVTAIRNLRVARMGVNKSSESLDAVINRFRKKSDHMMQQAESRASDKKEDLQMPIGGQSPFQMSIPNLTGGFLRPPTAAFDTGFFTKLNERDQTRLRRYAEYWRAYNGQPEPDQVDSEDPLNSWNYIRKIIDVGVYFLVGAGFTIKVPKPMIPITGPYLEEVWKQNGREAFTYDRAITASVTGDWYAMVGRQQPSAMERAVRPFSKGRVRFKGFGSEQVFPTWDPIDSDSMVACRIETYYSEVSEAVTVGGAPAAFQRHTLTITPTMIISQLNQDSVPKFTKNLLGEIPVVHCKNLPLPGYHGGLSDVEDLINVVRDMNEKTTDISNSINYNGTPTIAIFGAKAKDLPKTADTVWAGLPTDAKIQVIRMGLEDIGAATKYVEIVKKTIHELSSVPEAAMGSGMAISNTSGLALHMTFQPMIQKSTVKRAFFEPAIERMNYFALRLGAIEGDIDLPFDMCHCGGKIVEVETGKLLEQWDPNTESFVATPERKKKCFRVDPQTLQFQTPKDVVVKALLNYGVGSHVGELPFEETKTQAREGKKSFWATGAKAMAEEGAPPVQVPLNEFPKEPEQVTVITKYVSPITGEAVKEHREVMVLIPTDCVVPQYANPYDNDVDLGNVIPKDDAVTATYLALAQSQGWVDAEFCQDQFPQIAAAKSEINERLARQKSKEAQAASNDEAKQRHQELAAKDQAESSVAGKAKASEAQK